MLKHYIKFAIRNFRSNKTIFAGSLATLCLGALCISLLFSYVYNELTMDDFHENVEDVYMITMKPSPKSDWSYPFKGDYNEYPEVEYITSLISFQNDEIKLKHKDYTYTPTGMVVDSSFFDVFNFKLTIGNENTILNDYEAIILSEDFSKKLFGDENPIGEIVDFEVRMHQGPHVVKGIVKIPSNSSLKFDILIPNAGIHYGRMGIPFVRLKKEIGQYDFDEKIKNSNNNVPNVIPRLSESVTRTVSLKELYYSSDFASLKNYPTFSWGNKKNIDILLIIILIILLVSILNFSNLQIVNVNSVIKNIAISKINGAFKKNIFGQKIVENIIVVVISALIITIVFNLTIPYFNAFMKVNLAPPLWKILLINVLFVVLIVGVGMIYPIICIDRFSGVLKVNKHQQLKGKHFIIVLQYALAFILLISSIVVTKQLQLMLSKDLGFNTKNTMKVKLYYEPPFNPYVRSWSEDEQDAYRKKIREKPEYIKNQLASFSGIKNMGQGRSPLDIFQIEWKTKQETSGFESLNTLTISTECQKVFGFELLEGRFFDKQMDQERSNKLIINETAKKHWGIENIESTVIENISWGKNFEIIGVVKDFNYEHLASRPKPLIILYWEDAGADYFVQFHNNQNQEAIAQIQKLFNEVNPNQTFNYSFLTNDIAALYDKEKRLSTIYILFTIIALLISAIGLFTIALYDTQRRIKEIGVRKVNGATVPEILFMLNKDFMKWVLLAFIIGCPIAYYAMHKWLENFAYKTSLSWWVFVLAGVFTLIIALLTVSWQSYKAATQNPTESLRDE